MARLSRLLALALVAGVLVVAGGDRPGPPPGSVREVTDLGPVTWDHRILGRDGGLSARWGGRLDLGVRRHRDQRSRC